MARVDKFFLFVGSYLGIDLGLEVCVVMTEWLNRFVEFFVWGSAPFFAIVMVVTMVVAVLKKSWGFSAISSFLLLAFLLVGYEHYPSDNQIPKWMWFFYWVSMSCVMLVFAASLGHLDEKYAGTTTSIEG